MMCIGSTPEPAGPGETPIAQKLRLLARPQDSLTQPRARIIGLIAAVAVSCQEATMTPRPSPTSQLASLTPRTPTTPTPACSSPATTPGWGPPPCRARHLGGACPPPDSAPPSCPLGQNGIAALQLVRPRRLGFGGDINREALLTPFTGMILSSPPALPLNADADRARCAPHFNPEPSPQGHTPLHCNDDGASRVSRPAVRDAKVLPTFS
jgi:hypothetical protein